MTYNQKQTLHRFLQTLFGSKLARDISIDYTGEVMVEDDVWLSEGCAIHSHSHATQNYSYFPVVFESEEQLLKVQKALGERDIFPRRYFYPSLDTLSYIEPKQHMPHSRDISTRIMCLPVYAELKKEEQNIIINTIKENLK